MSSLLDLKGKLLTIATNLSPPFVFLKYDGTHNRWKFNGGVEVKLLEMLSNHFNFTYQVINCNSDWGIRLSNNTWTGIIGKIVSKEADIGFAGLTVTDDRSRAVYFTDPHIITSVTFITPPPKTKPKITLVIEPFDPLVWVCIISSVILLVTIEGLIISKWEQYSRLHLKWGIISALLKQTFCCRPPNVIHLRILISFWLLVCLVLTASYSGCLYSLMAIPSRAKPIDDLTELAAKQRQGCIQVTAIQSSSYFECLKSSTVGIHKELGQYLKPVKDKEQGLEVVKNSSNSVQQYAFISHRDHLMYGFLRFGSDYIYLPPPTEESNIFVDVMGIALSVDFQYKHDFNNLISGLKNNGFLDYWRQTANKIFNSRHHYRNYQILYLDQLQSAIYLYIIGQIFTFIMLIFEILNNRPLNRNL